MRKAVFLDRDGTIMKDVHYCRRVEDVEILPTVGEGLRLLRDNGFLLAIITNQSGISRGYFTEDTLSRIHETMLQKLAPYGIQVDAIYYCPHHPEAMCECRKPRPKLAFKAIRDLRIDARKSYFIGDRLMDIQLAKAIGCKGVMLQSEYVKTELVNSDVLPDYIAPSFETAAKWIIQQSNETGD